MSAPTIYLTNAASRKPPQRGPGRVWTIMAAPRPQYGEAGEGSVPALVPPLVWVRMAKAGDISMEAYRDRYRVAIDGEHLQPGRLNSSLGEAVADGDTLLCACSREAASQGRCHRIWAAEMLRAAGWQVVLDGFLLAQVSP